MAASCSSSSSPPPGHHWRRSSVVRFIPQKWNWVPPRSSRTRSRRRYAATTAASTASKSPRRSASPASTRCVSTGSRSMVIRSSSRLRIPPCSPCSYPGAWAPATPVNWWRWCSAPRCCATPPSSRAGSGTRSDPANCPNASPLGRRRPAWSARPCPCALLSRTGCSPISRSPGGY